MQKMTAAKISIIESYAESEIETFSVTIQPLPSLGHDHV
jgi:hypothetical protein